MLNLTQNVEILIQIYKKIELSLMLKSHTTKLTKLASKHSHLTVRPEIGPGGSVTLISLEWHETCG